MWTLTLLTDQADSLKRSPTHTHSIMGVSRDVGSETQEKDKGFHNIALAKVENAQLSMSNKWMEAAAVDCIRQLARIDTLQPSMLYWCICS